MNKQYISQYLGRCLLIMLYLFGSNQVLSNPQGPQVIHGQVDLSRANANTLNITNSPNAIVNWQSFSIGSKETTHFLQQSANSAILNRVTGQDLSAILGHLTSNGRVFLINSNGIVFGPDSIVDTAGFIGSTLNITDKDFLAGKLRFQGGPDAGSIKNQGLIQARDAGGVYLISPNIENSGLIRTDKGNLLLAAGRKLTISSLDVDHIQFEIQAPENEVVNIGELLTNGGAMGIFAGSIQNHGVIEAKTVTVDKQGNIRLAAKSDIHIEAESKISASGPQGGNIYVESETGTTQLSGTIGAKGNKEMGGEIHVLGEHVHLVDKANIDVSGEQGGGTILVGGGYQGHGEVKNAKSTTIAPDVSIQADAISEGDGGKVIVWADETASIHGTLTARGGKIAGNGGLIETSGKQNLTLSTTPDASAPKGNPGTWLIDPTDITIVNGGGGAIGTNLIDVANINNTLNNGVNITINTKSAETDMGNITQSTGAAISKTSGAEVTLTLKAANNISLGDSISSNSNALNLNIEADNDDNGLGAVNINANINTAGGTIDISGDGAINSSGVLRGGDISITSNTSINLNGLDVNSNSVNGNSITIDTIGALFVSGALNARSDGPNDAGDITIGKTLTPSSIIVDRLSTRNLGGGVGGDIRVTTPGSLTVTGAFTRDNDGLSVDPNDPAIDPNNIASIGSEADGNGGIIDITAGNGITTVAGIVSDSISSGNGGNLSLASQSGTISVGIVDSSSVNGNGGQVNIDAGSNINTAAIESGSISGQSGDINLSSDGAINSTGVLQGADIKITSNELISLNGLTTNSISVIGSSISIDTLGALSVSGALNTRSDSAGDAGNITIGSTLAPSGIVVDRLSTRNLGGGTGGDIRVTTPGSLTVTGAFLRNTGIVVDQNDPLNDPNDIASIASEASETGGVINIDAGDGITTVAGIFSDSISSGNGGNLTLSSQNGAISTGVVDSSSVDRIGGQVNIDAGSNIDTTAIVSRSLSGQGGGINLRSGENITSGLVDFGSGSQGLGGDPLIANAAGIINLTALSPNFSDIIIGNSIRSSDILLPNTLSTLGGNVSLFVDTSYYLTSILSTTGGDVTVDSLGTLTAAAPIQTSGGNINLSGTNVNVTALLLDAGTSTGSINFTSSGGIDFQNSTLITDNLNFNGSVSGTGLLTLRPVTTGKTINIGSANDSFLSASNTESLRDFSGALSIGGRITTETATTEAIAGNIFVHNDFEINGDLTLISLGNIKVNPESSIRSGNILTLAALGQLAGTEGDISDPGLAAEFFFDAPTTIFFANNQSGTSLNPLTTKSAVNTVRVGAGAGEAFFDGAPGNIVASDQQIRNIFNSFSNRGITLNNNILNTQATNLSGIIGQSIPPELIRSEEEDITPASSLLLKEEVTQRSQRSWSQTVTKAASFEQWMETGPQTTYGFNVTTIQTIVPLNSHIRLTLYVSEPGTSTVTFMSNQDVSTITFEVYSSGNYILDVPFIQPQLNIHIPLEMQDTQDNVLNETPISVMADGDIEPNYLVIKDGAPENAAKLGEILTETLQPIDRNSEAKFSQQVTIEFKTERNGKPVQSRVTEAIITPKEIDLAVGAKLIDPILFGPPDLIRPTTGETTEYRFFSLSDFDKASVKILHVTGFSSVNNTLIEKVKKNSWSKIQYWDGKNDSQRQPSFGDHQLEVRAWRHDKLQTTVKSNSIVTVTKP